MPGGMESMKETPTESPHRAKPANKHGTLRRGSPGPATELAVRTSLVFVLGATE